MLDCQITYIFSHAFLIENKSEPLADMTDSVKRLGHEPDIREIVFRPQAGR